MSDSTTSYESIPQEVRCKCGRKIKMRVSWMLENHGRRFYGARTGRKRDVDFFYWEDPPMDVKAATVLRVFQERMDILEKEKKEALEGTKEAEEGKLGAEEGRKAAEELALEAEEGKKEAEEGEKKAEEGLNSSNEKLAKLKMELKAIHEELRVADGELRKLKFLLCILFFVVGLRS